MDDLEITRRCAEAMGPELCWTDVNGRWYSNDEAGNEAIWDPLRDDAQAMALVKRFKLLLTPDGDSNWICSGLGGEGCSESPDLNRAICLAVAQREKE